jgi:hypothetical protein
MFVHVSPWTNIKSFFLHKITSVHFPNKTLGLFPYNNKIIDVGIEVLTAVVMKSTIFWDITPCSPLKVNRRFGGKYRLNLQSRRISRPRHQATSFTLVSCLDYFFDPEDGGHMFLRNIG